MSFRATPLFLVKFLLASIIISCSSIDEVGILVPPTVEEDSALPSVLLNVANKERLLHLRTYGDSSSPMLMIMHGTYSDTKPYRQIARSLSEKYFVVLYDQRGCGLSERIEQEEFSLESAVEEMNQVKMTFSPKRKVTIIGHSWGGAISTLYCATYPHEVNQLVLLEPMPLTGRDMQEVYKTIVDVNYFEPMWNEMAQNGQAISPRNHALLDFKARMILQGEATSAYHCQGRNPPDWSVHRVGAYLEYIRYQVLGNPNKGFNYDFRKGIMEFNIPVLLLGGSCSSLGYNMQKKYTEPHFRQVILEEIEDSGHRMFIEKFEIVDKRIKKYLHEF